MKKYLAAAMAVCCLGTANAALVSVAGRDWRQVTETLGFSWGEIASVCNQASGVCSGSIAGVSFDGYTWASERDVAALFDALILPASTQFAAFPTTYLNFGSSDIAAAIGIGAFTPTSVSFNVAADTQTELVRGFTRTLVFGGGQAAVGDLLDYLDPKDFSYRDRASLATGVGSGLTSPTLGVWMYSTPAVSPVPLPAAAWLMVSGIGALGVAARRRKAA